MGKCLIILSFALLLGCSLIPGLSNARSARIQNEQEYDTENYSYDDYPTLDSENDVDGDDYGDDDSYNYSYDEYPDLTSDYQEDDESYADGDIYDESDYDEDTDDDDEEIMNSEEEVYGPRKVDNDKDDYSDEDDEYEDENDDDIYVSDDLDEASNAKKSRRSSARVVFKPHNKSLQKDKENIMYSDDV